MMEKTINELKEDLKLAKEANELTAKNLANIVKEATIKIINELDFEKDITIELIKDIMDNIKEALKEIGEDSIENVKIVSEAIISGVDEVLKGKLSQKAQKLKEIHETLSNEVKEDVKDIFENFKAFSELSLDILKNATKGAIKGVNEVLEKETKNDKNN
jgi:transcriptional regulator of heat shock response